MADDEQFSLCWNNFNSNLSAGFHESLCRGDLVDVTLAAEGQFVKAHRLVLSVCSPYFRKMFTQMPANQHAFVFLKDVSHTALKDLIQFMYCGEVNVKQEALPAFISTAEALQIKGLTDSDPPQSQTPPEPSTPTPPQIQQIATSPRVRQRTSTSRSYKIETVDDSGEEQKQQPTQIVIQTTAAPPQATIVHHAPQQQQQQHHIQTAQATQQQQQIVTAAPTTTTTTVLTQKRPAQRSIGSSAPHIKRTKSTIETIVDTSNEAAQQNVQVQQQPQQITVQAAVVTTDKSGHQQAETEYIDLPIDLPTKSEPEYADEAGDVEGDHEGTYVEDDAYADIRYDESYFTENEDGGNNVSSGTTTVSTGGGNSTATTSKAVIKQQQSSFSDSTYVDGGAGDQGNNDAQVTSEGEAAADDCLEEGECFAEAGDDEMQDEQEPEEQDEDAYDNAEVQDGEREEEELENDDEHCPLTIDEACQTDTPNLNVGEDDGDANMSDDENDDHLDDTAGSLNEAEANEVNEQMDVSEADSGDHVPPAVTAVNAEGEPVQNDTQSTTNSPKKSELAENTENIGDKIFIPSDGKANEMIPLYVGCRVHVSRKILKHVFVPNPAIYTARLLEIVYGKEFLEKLAMEDEEENKIEQLEKCRLEAITSHVTQLFGLRGRKLTEAEVLEFIDEKLKHIAENL